MKQDRYPGSGPDPGLYGSDRDFFKRVWQRVMPEEREDCPIELLPEPETSLAVPPSPAPSFALSAANRLHADEPAENYPVENDVACLGASSAVYGKQLQDFIFHELSDWKVYRALAGRAGTSAARRVLCGIAADEYRHAKRLSTAYFLISGVRYWPNCLPAPVIGSYLGMLRRRFSDEQRGEAEYLAAANETNDRCLHELYLELAQEEARHAQLIRTILEQM